MRPFPDRVPWLSRCQGCGLGWADPQPGEKELAEIYGDHYYEQFGFVEENGGPHKGLSLIKQATYSRILRHAEKILGPDSGQRRLLDVGCGLGFSLEAAAKRGWEPLGLDPLASESEGRRGLHGQPIRKGTLETFRPDHPFEAVSMVDLIEHVRDPVAAIARAAEFLAPGGLLLVATNNIESWMSRVMGGRWPLLIRAHLWFLSPRTLSFAAKKAGLKVLATRTSWRTYNTDYICSILARGTNFALARAVSRWILRWVPRPLRLIPWPPIPEGMVVIARKP